MEVQLTKGCVQFDRESKVGGEIVDLRKNVNSLLMMAMVCG